MALGQQTLNYLRSAITHPDALNDLVNHINGDSSPSFSANVTVEDDVLLGLGTGNPARVSWDTTDANANATFLQLPTGGAVDVPVIVIGQGIESVDLGLYDGVVDPRVAMFSVGAVTTGPVFEFRKARGTVAAPTVITTGDDLGQINAYGYSGAGGYVNAARILLDSEGTIATTRVGGKIVLSTATDAAPSVLTAALTINSAQLVTCAAGLTLTTGTLTISSGDITFTVASDINIAANTAAALEVDDGTTKLMAIDSRNTLKDVSTVTITGQATTIASEGATHANPSLNIAAKTITYTGTTQTTYQKGAMLSVGVLTITDASVMTLDAASSVHINAIAAAGGSLTITASHMISTSVADCFLTNAGVWTDTSCWEAIKQSVVRGTDHAKDMVSKVLESLVPATWQYQDSFEATLTHQDGTETVTRLPLNDRGRQRVGIVYDDLPDELRAPGEEKAVSAGLLSSFALAALKTLWDRNKELEARLAKLESA